MQRASDALRQRLIAAPDGGVRPATQAVSARSAGYAAQMSRKSSTAQRAGLIAVAVALAAALAAAGARLAGRSPGTGARGRDRPTEQTYTCACGATYRVSGTDRHRVYWPAGASEDAAVLGDSCLECDAPLPGGRAGDQEASPRP
jgi:hypothetical protein